MYTVSDINILMIKSRYLHLPSQHVSSRTEFSHKTSQLSHVKVVSFMLEEYANKIFQVWFCVTKCELFSCLKFLTISHNSSPVEKSSR